MSIKLRDLLNEDNMKENRFNYSLILHCIENLNSLMEDAHFEWEFVFSWWRI